MRKLIIAALAILLVFGAAIFPADAQDDRVQTDDVFVFDGPEKVEPAPIPFDWHVVAMWGDVWANGRAFGTVDFYLFWEADDTPRAELWALWKGNPTQVCVGDIFETPDGEPIFFGEAVAGEQAATCHMARTPDFDEISLFIATEDGQWASSIMTNPAWQRADAVGAFG